jgi:membrane dipeptidase
MRPLILPPLFLTLISANSAIAQTPVSQAAIDRITKNAILIDTHNDITSRTEAGFDIGKPSTETNTDLPRLRQGGVGAVFFAVYVGANYTNGNHSANRALQMIDTVRTDIAARYPNDFQLAFTAADIEAAHKKGKIAALMGIEGGHSIEDSPRLLRDFYALGIRYMTLTHTNTNGWADSSGDIDRAGVEHHNGLTPLGKQIIAEMNRLGMIVDISHVADKTFFDALETSKAPIFASHSSCRALANVPRNMTDEMIIALAKKNGVVQINFSCDFLSQKSADAQKAQGGGMVARYNEITEKYKNEPDKLQVEMTKMMTELKATMVRATLDDVVAHIDHVVKIAGIDAVGIGSDFDGVVCTPDGLDDVSKFPNLTRALLTKGYSEKDILKIYGGNTLRLMRAVEAASEKGIANKGK